jgi:urate oxidase
MPYPIWVGDRLLIEFPHQYTINDHRMQEGGTRIEFFEKFKDEFDYRYRIGCENPTMMNVITHAYLISRIPFVDTFEQIIGYVKSHNEVWLARRGDVAAWARRYVLENK